MRAWEGNEDNRHTESSPRSTQHVAATLILQSLAVCVAVHRSEILRRRRRGKKKSGSERVSIFFSLAFHSSLPRSFLLLRACCPFFLTRKKRMPSYSRLIDFGFYSLILTASSPPFLSPLSKFIHRAPKKPKASLEDKQDPSRHRITQDTKVQLETRYRVTKPRCHQPKCRKRS